MFTLPHDTRLSSRFIPTRWLITAVISMGIIIVIATAALGVIIIKRLTYETKQELLSAPTVPALNHFTSVLLDEPLGSQITTITPISPQKIAILIRNNGPDRILILNIVSGKLESRVQISNHTNRR